MKIIYFTSACEKSDYATFRKNWSVSLNSTIQNIHNRLIRSLGLTHEVEVISIRPFSQTKCYFRFLAADKKQEGKINWNYLQIKRNSLTRYFSVKKQTWSILDKTNLNKS